MTNQTYSLGLIRDGLGTWNSLHGKAQNKPLVSLVLTMFLDGLIQAYPQLLNDAGESAVCPH